MEAENRYDLWFEDALKNNLTLEFAFQSYVKRWISLKTTVGTELSFMFVTYDFGALLSAM
jgi:hypothetical protein